MDEKVIRVFMVDDDEDDYVLTRDMLAEAVGARFELEWVDTYEAGLEAMERAGHDVYLVDYRLGGRDGLELLCAAIAGGCRAPIIMLTGRGDRAVDVAAMKAGAADYLDKGQLSAPLLERSIRYAIERVRAEEKLEHLNLVLLAIRSVNQLIVREKDRDRLLRGACESLIETRGYHNAWIALLDESGGLLTYAEAGLGGEFSSMVEQLKRGELAACWRRALTQSEVVVTQDPPSACADCPLAMNYGGREAVTICLEHGKKVYGLLSASIPAHLTADEKEQVLFQEVAGDIAFALHSIELEERRQRAEESLRESERRLEEAQAMGRIGDWKFDVDSQKITWSDQVFKLYERDPGLGAPTPEEEATYYSPEQARILREYARRSIETGEEFEYDLEVKLSSGRTGCFSACMHPIKDESGRVVELFGTVQDVTERKLAEEQVRRHLERIEALREIDRAITSTLDLTEVLDTILEELERVIPYHSAGIFLFSEGIARLTAGRGFPDMERVLQISFPVEEDPLTCELLQGKHPLVLADAQADERFLARGGTEYVRSWIGVPLIASGRVVGFLAVDHREPGFYDKESAEMAQAFASQVTIAIENARLYEEAQRELAERKRAEEELRQSFEKLRRALEGTVTTLVSVIEMRDPYTAGHQRRVTQLTCAIARDMGLPEEQIEGLRMAGLIHDIGKITIPAEILSNPGRLNDFQWGMIRAHPQIGYEILKTVEFPWPVAQIVLQHHERVDGSGYPQGLSDGDILMKARILAVADVVEAMASHRPYRPPRGLDKALEEISQNRGVLYDPEVVDVCLKLFTEKEFTFE